jgi:glycosyltransferase involved in cell wall biosynthesis
MAGDAGIGTYVSQLLPRIMALRPGWRFTVLSRPGAPHLGNGAEYRDCTAPIYSIGEQAELFAKTPRDADLFWSPHYNIPLAYRGPLFVTIHDLGHLTLPEFTNSLPKHLYARTMYGAVRRKARGIVCVSDHTRREYARLVGKGRAEPTTIHSGVDDAWRSANELPRPAQRTRPYIVYVGSVKPHKNLIALLAAFAALSSKIPHDLVIVGRRDRMTTDSAALEEAERLGDRVVITGELASEDVRAHVAHAELLVMPSLFEGFGFPPIEAMAAGCLCVVSNAASLPEICGDAAEYCDPHDPGSIADAMRRVLEDSSLQSQLRARGRERAAMFDWNVCADETLAAMERVLGGRVHA